LAAASQAEQDLTARARAIHERVITLDTHNDIEPSNFTRACNYTMNLTTQVSLPKMKAGGLDVSFMVVYVGQSNPPQVADAFRPSGYERAYKAAVAKFDAIHYLTKEIAPNDIELSLTAADVTRIAKSGKKVAVIGIENGYPLGTDIKRVKEFWDRGGRYMSLAHNGHNQLSDSNTGEANNQWSWGGLSPLGRQVIEDEQVGNHGRRVAPVEGSDDADGRSLEGASHRVAFGRSQIRERQPQYGRRDADGGEDERRRHPDGGLVRVR
jgi:membrane dipeptidase